jgi:hypothetical protein
MLVEIWSIGDRGSENYVIITPLVSETNKWYVINGEYEVTPNKREHKMIVYIRPTPFHKGTQAAYTSYYLGDVEHNGDYNDTINRYQETKKVVSRNKVKLKVKSKSRVDHTTDPNMWEDNTPF